MSIAARFALSLAVACFACSGVRVTTDYDPSTDFGAVRSYAWLDQRSGVQGDREDVASLLDGRVRRAVDAELQRKGLVLADDPAEADVLVTYLLGFETKVDPVTVHTGFGWGTGHYGSGVGVGVGTGTTGRQYEEGTLVIDLVDSSAQQLLWRGSGQSRIGHASTPEQSEAQVRHVVAEILASFPPGSANP